MLIDIHDTAVSLQWDGIHIKDGDRYARITPYLDEEGQPVDILEAYKMTDYDDLIDDDQIVHDLVAEHWDGVIRMIEKAHDGY